ncbi:MAG: GSCFA domain-containing protein [Bacteroidetes bacterium]|nr:GSCFA domain-containing protein [Bacteroidota bacterium]
MLFNLPIHIKKITPPVKYDERILLMGSCFTEHIGDFLKSHKFNVLQNPNGIVFEPQMLCSSILDYIDQKKYSEHDLVYENERWHSWDHHSVFSHPSKEMVLQRIQESIKQAHDFLKNADWLIITFGTSFHYLFKTQNRIVANCHKVPANSFTKQLGTIEETVTAIDTMLYRLFHFNPKIKIIFTVSPVRHVRDGVVENNRSKARLLEAVHHVVDKFDKLYYFPSYELIIDVLRDHRFYDIDLVHPNYAATSFVLEKFCENCMDKQTRNILEKMKEIVIAKNHQPFHFASEQHQKFRKKYLSECVQLQTQYPFLNLQEEINFFQAG